jgi:endoglucanase
MTDKFLQLMAKKKMGWTAWNYSDNARTGAVWNAGTCATGAWIDGNLKPAGAYIKTQIKGLPA